MQYKQKIPLEYRQPHLKRIKEVKVPREKPAQTKPHTYPDILKLTKNKRAGPTIQINPKSNTKIEPLQ